MNLAIVHEDYNYCFNEITNLTSEKLVVSLLGA